MNPDILADTYLYLLIGITVKYHLSKIRNIDTNNTNTNTNLLKHYILLGIFISYYYIDIDIVKNI